MFLESESIAISLDIANAIAHPSINQFAGNSRRLMANKEILMLALIVCATARALHICTRACSDRNFIPHGQSDWHAE